ncbi:MAG: hypothetical protein D6812_09875 [Deltaproteobacteria bacterium]|nr:MAG: hypothetical protein D6812_09875 [Deltaproteobacteria bacterium]
MGTFHIASLKEALKRLLKGVATLHPHLRGELRASIEALSNPRRLWGSTDLTVLLHDLSVSGSLAVDFYANGFALTTDEVRVELLWRGDVGEATVVVTPTEPLLPRSVGTAGYILAVLTGVISAPELD